MGLSSEFELIYKITTENIEALDGLPSKQQKVALAAEYSSQELGKFEEALKGLIGSGSTYAQSLDRISSSTVAADKTNRDIARTIQANNKAEAERVRALKASAAAEEENAAKSVAAAKLRQREADQEAAAYRRLQAAHAAALREEEKRNASGVNVGRTLQGVGQLGGMGNAGYGLSSLASSAGVAGLAAGGALLAGIGTVELVKDSAKNAQELQVLSRELGISFQQVQKLQQAAALAGTDLGNMSMAARKLGDALESPGAEGKKTADAMTKLGVSLHQDMGSALEDVIKKFDQIQDPAERASLGAALFGRNWVAIANVAHELNNVHDAFSKDVQKDLLDAHHATAEFGNAATIAEGQFSSLVVQIGKVSAAAHQLGGGPANLFASLAMGDKGREAILADHTKRPFQPLGPPNIGDISRSEKVLHDSTSREGLDVQLSEAKKNLADATARLSADTKVFATDDTRRKEESDVIRLRKQVEGIEAQLNRGSSAKHGPDLDRYVSDYVTKAREGETGPLGRLRADAENAIRDKGLTGDLRDKYMGGYAENVKKILAQYQQHAAKEGMAEAGRNDKEKEEILAEIQKKVDDWQKEADKAVQADIGNAQRSQDLYQQHLEQGAVTRSNANISHIDEQADQIGGQNKINQVYEERMRLAKEIKDLQYKAADDIESASEQALAKQQASYELERATTEARVEREQKILEIRRQQTEETRSFATGLFNAGISGGMSKYLQGMGRHVLDGIVGNAGEMMMGSLNSKLSLDRGGLLGTPDHPNALGKLTKDSWLGFDPLKVAQSNAAKVAKDQETKDKPLTDNSTATTENTKATAALTATLGAIGHLDTSGLPGMENAASVPQQSSASTSDKAGDMSVMSDAVSASLGDVMKPFNSLAKMIGIGGTAAFIDSGIGIASSASAAFASKPDTSKTQAHASGAQPASHPMTVDEFSKVFTSGWQTISGATDTSQIGTVTQPDTSAPVEASDIRSAPPLHVTPPQAGGINTIFNAYSDRPTASSVEAIQKAIKVPGAAPAHSLAAPPLPQGTTQNAPAPPTRAVPLQVAAPEKQATSSAINDIKPTIDRLSEAVTSMGDSVNVNANDAPTVPVESTPYRGGLQSRDYPDYSAPERDIRSVSPIITQPMIEQPPLSSIGAMPSIDAMTRMLRNVPQSITTQADTDSGIDSAPAIRSEPLAEPSVPSRPIWDTVPTFRPLDGGVGFPPAPSVSSQPQSDIGSLAAILAQQDRSISSPPVQSADMASAPDITPISASDTGGVRLAPFGTASGISGPTGDGGSSLADILGAAIQGSIGDTSAAAPNWNMASQQIGQVGQAPSIAMQLPEHDTADLAMSGLGKLGDSLAKNAGALSQSTNATLSTLGDLGSGIGDVFSGQSINVLMKGAKQNPLDGSWESADTTEQIGAGIGLGTTLAGGTMAAIQGFSKGGARGDLQGVGSILGTAAAIDPEPISKGILALGATISGIVSSLLGDPKADRIKQEEKTQVYDQFIAPAARDYNFANSGGGGAILGEDGGSSGGGRTANYYTTISAHDAQSFYNLMKQDPSQMADVVLTAISAGGVGALTQELNWHAQHS